MLSNILIHIGYHKTGSSWLQKEIFSGNNETFIPLSIGNRPKYLGKYFVFNHEHNFLSPYQSNKKLINKEIDLILSKINIGSRIPVISNERLSGNPHSGGFDSKIISDRLNEYFPNAKIFICIREQKNMILSSYFQYLKVGGTESLNNYLTRNYDGRKPGFSLDHLDYYDLIFYYHKLFPSKNILVLTYESFKDTPHRFVTDIGKFVSVDIHIDKLNFNVIHGKRTTNIIESKFPFLNYFTHCSSVNSYSPFYVKGSSRLIDRMNEIFYKFDSNYMKKLMRQVDSIVKDRYQEGNRQLSKLIGTDLSKYGYHN